MNQVKISPLVSIGLGALLQNRAAVISVLCRLRDELEKTIAVIDAIETQMMKRSFSLRLAAIATEHGII